MKTNFKKSDYEALFEKVKNGTLKIDSETGTIHIPKGTNTEEVPATGFLGALDEGKQPEGYAKVKVVYTK